MEFRGEGAVGVTTGNLPDIDFIGKIVSKMNEGAMVLMQRCGKFALPAGLLVALAGCVVAPLPPRQIPLVAVPGPAKTAAAFHEDDVACRASAAAPPPAAPSPAAPSPAAPSPAEQGAQAEQDGQQAAMAAQGLYLHCMESRSNVVQPLTVAIPAPYRIYAAYPGYYGPYGGYGGYPWLYDGYPGFGVYGGIYGGYGFREGFRGGGRGWR